jgi:hypothetical protein
MTAPLPQLPEVPFPVYGLGPRFTAERTIDVWNRLGDGITGPLWYVALAHADSSGETVTVVTDGRLDTGTSRQHTAVEDVVRIVLLGLASAPANGLSLTRLETLTETAGEPPWRTEDFTINGQPHPFSTYHHGPLIAAYADLGETVVGFYGPRGDQLVSRAHLEPVNQALHTYAPPASP